MPEEIDGMKMTKNKDLHCKIWVQGKIIEYKNKTSNKKGSKI